MQVKWGTHIQVMFVNFFLTISNIDSWQKGNWPNKLIWTVANTYSNTDEHTNIHYIPLLWQLCWAHTCRLNKQLKTVLQAPLQYTNLETICYSGQNVVTKPILFHGVIVLVFPPIILDWQIVHVLGN